MKIELELDGHVYVLFGESIGPIKIKNIDAPREDRLINQAETIRMQDTRIAELEAERDELKAELTKTKVTAYLWRHEPSDEVKKERDDAIAERDALTEKLKETENARDRAFEKACEQIELKNGFKTERDALQARIGQLEGELKDMVALATGKVNETRELQARIDKIAIHCFKNCITIDPCYIGLTTILTGKDTA